MSLSAMQLICNGSATEDGGCSVVLLMYCSSLVTSVRVSEWAVAAEVSTSGLGSVTPLTLRLHDAACRPADQLTAGHCSMPSQRVRPIQ